MDIDAQAVEVCQLSLYLKLLKDETTASAHQYLLDFEQQALLPSLAKNIVCGNSLIGTDILDGQLFPSDEERKLNPMNFEDAFPHIFRCSSPAVREDIEPYTIARSIGREGGRIVHPAVLKDPSCGFDAIVGNPPYVRIQGFPRHQIEYLTSHYRSATGNCDLYVSFVERSYQLLRQGGRLGYIVPNKFLRTDYGEGLRGLIAKDKALVELVDFGASQVFDATTYTCLLFLSQARNETFGFAKAEAKPEALPPSFALESADSLNHRAWTFADQGTAGLLAKLSVNAKRLLDLPAEMSRGSSTGDDEVFVVDINTKIEKKILRIPVYATDFNRYTLAPNAKWRVVFPYVPVNDDYRLLSEPELRRRFPRAYAHLKSKQAQLKKRKQYAAWYGFSAPRNLILHDGAQIAVPLLADKGLFSLIPETTRGKLCPMASGGFTITLGRTAPVQPAYVLGLLNSSLLFWALRQMSNLFRGGWITCTKQYFGELPIVLPDKARHDQMVRLVEQMLAAKKQLAKAKTDKDKTYFGNRCAGLDRQIDRLVYDLYGLTEDEIKIVESR